MFRWRTVRQAWLVLSSLCVAGFAAAAPLDDLTSAQRQWIGERCLPVQYDGDTDRLRECLDREARAIGDGAAADAVAELALDERHALARRCVPDDQACRQRELDALALVPPPALDVLRPDERDAVLRACHTVQGSDGPAAWRRCARQRAAELQQGAPVSLDALGLLERMALFNDCASDELPVERYRTCLADGGARIVDSSNGAQPVAAGANTGPSSTLLGVAAAQAPSRPATLARRTSAVEARPLDESLTAASAARAPEGDITLIEDRSDSGPLLGASAPQELSIEPDAGETPVSRLVARLGTSVSGLDTTGRVALLAAALLPLMLLATRWISRHRGAQAIGPHGTRRNPGLAQRVRSEAVNPVFDPSDPGPLSDGLESRFAYPDDELFDALDATIAEDIGPALPVADEFAAWSDADAERPPAARAVSRDTPTVLIGRSPVQATEQQSPHADPVTPVSTAAPSSVRSNPVSRFGRWLDTQPEAQRLQHAIELLVYWIAYGDERYDQEHASAMRRSTDQDAATVIKRTVLLEDVHAYADVIRWMLGNTSIEQRRQTLELLIALLVTDATPTPVQNTQLRFIADAFGIGRISLESLWQQFFGAPLPALPDVDRPEWWDSIDEDRLREHDARALANAAPERQFAARLGLPLDVPQDPARIRAAYRLAVLRTEPGRFDALGERERALAGHQLARFDEAHDALLAVTA